MKESARNTDLPKENEDALAAFRDAVAHDLLALALLHNEELSGELIAQLKSEGVPAQPATEADFRSRHRGHAAFSPGRHLAGKRP